jgi:short-subunit dehydrogenase
MSIFAVLSWIATVALLLSPVMYILLNTILPMMLGVQDLKQKYAANWALVTGGSSGIGKEIVKKLLQQGLNVVIVARDEPVFDQTVKELNALSQSSTKGSKAKPPEIRKVCANLADGSGKWMEDVKDATKDIDIQIVFNNAGFILTGFFEQHSVEAQLSNFHCNLTANVILTHHFYGLLLSKEKRGCIVFTSSSAGFIPNPFAVMYGCTKAGVSELAASLAVEGKCRGIDVHSVHPSPVHSRFTAGGGNDVKVHKVDAIEMAYKFATGPEVLPNQIFSAIGRAPVMIDLGSTSVGMRLVVHILGFNLMTYLFAMFAPLMPDFKRNVRKTD